MTANLIKNKEMLMDDHICPACNDGEAVLPALTAMVGERSGRMRNAGKYLVCAKCHKKQWCLFYGRPGKDYGKSE